MSMRKPVVLVDNSHCCLSLITLGENKAGPYRIREKASETNSKKSETMGEEKTAARLHHYKQQSISQYDVIFFFFPGSNELLLSPETLNFW